MGKTALISASFKISAGIITAALALSLMFCIAKADSITIDSILTEAFGPEVASQCRGYFNEENIPQGEVAAVKEALRLIVKAGYPENCPKEYLKMAAQLANAGIGLGDLTNKIREGIAKGVDSGRLVHVLGRRTEALQEGRVLTLQLEQEGVRFLDHQMAYKVFADYLLRGVKRSDLTASVRDGNQKEYPALDSVVR